MKTKLFSVMSFYFPVVPITQNAFRLFLDDEQTLCSLRYLVSIYFFISSFTCFLPDFRLLPLRREKGEKTIKLIFCFIVDQGLKCTHPFQIRLRLSLHHFSHINTKQIYTQQITNIDAGSKITVIEAKILHKRRQIGT